MQTPGWTFEQVEFSSPFPAHKDLSNQLVFHGKTEDILKKAEDLRTFHGSHSFSKTNALGQTFRGVWPYDAHHTHDALGIHELLCELIYDLIFELLKHKNIVDFSWFIDMEIDMQDSPKKSSKMRYFFHESPALKTHWICFFSIRVTLWYRRRWSFVHGRWTKLSLRAVFKGGACCVEKGFEKGDVMQIPKPYNAS